MDSTFFSMVLEKGSTFAILAFILYYFLVIYIPKKDAAYEKRIDGLVLSFENAIKMISESHDNFRQDMNKRLWEIETVIKK